MYKARNDDEVHGRAEIERELRSREDHRVLRCFEQVERMDGHHTTKRVLMVKVSGELVRGRPRLGWIDSVVTLSNRG